MHASEPGSVRSPSLGSTEAASSSARFFGLHGRFRTGGRRVAVPAAGAVTLCGAPIVVHLPLQLLARGDGQLGSRLDVLPDAAGLPPSRARCGGGTRRRAPSPRKRPHPSTSSALRPTTMADLERLALDDLDAARAQLQPVARRCARAPRSCSCGKCSRTASTSVRLAVLLVDGDDEQLGAWRRRRPAAGRGASRRRRRRGSRSACSISI